MYPAGSGRHTKAITGLDLANDALYRTLLYKMSHKVYLSRLEGTSKPKHEEKLRQLGVKL